MPELRKPLKASPRRARDGESWFAIPADLVHKQDEIALAIHFISHRKLFGRAYWQLQPYYFYNMPQNSGVLIAPFVPTNAIFPERTRPGDIDLLIIPYENEELVLHRTLLRQRKWFF